MEEHFPAQRRACMMMSGRKCWPPQRWVVTLVDWPEGHSSATTRNTRSAALAAQARGHQEQPSDASTFGVASL